MYAPSFDLDSESREALEFDAVLERVAAHAGTAPGRARVEALEPAVDPATVRGRVATVREAGRHLEVAGRLVGVAVPDPSDALSLLEVANARLEPKALRDLSIAVDAAGAVRAAALELDAETFPNLTAIAGPLPDLRPAVREVLRFIEPDGRVADGASAELSKLRRAASRVGDRLRNMLESVLRRHPNAIQDAFVTQRNGRYVVPVRADAQRVVRGIVHASSSSGATLFVEPLESVDANNELVSLAERERDEEERLVVGWTERLRAEREAIARAIEGLAVFDAVQACALFGAAAGGVAPEIVEEGQAFELEAVRHPLLDHRLRSTGSACVPIDVRLEPADRLLVISGPNTGGKTVALKTCGLACLMAQCGIPVTAVRARLPAFRQVRADIGDHQSLDADLSTFSAHLATVERVLRELRTPALVLFDEIGTGTDPSEGAALARAILEDLRRPGVTTVATTHHGSLKSWAFTEPDVESAALDFDRETLTPTYRVEMHAAGVSAGIDVAERLGLDDRIVRRARELAGDRAVRAEAYLEALRARLDELGRMRDALERERSEVERRARRRLDEAEGEVEALKRRASDEVDRLIAAFRDRASSEVDAIRDAERRREAKADLERSRRRLEDGARRVRDSIEVAVKRAAGDRSTVAWKVESGAKARIVSLGREGEVVAVRGTKAEVRLGRVSFTVDVSDLDAPVDSGGERGPGPRRSAIARQASRAARRRTERADEADDRAIESPVELHLIGKRVDEAIPEVDRFLDASLMAGRHEVRVVHGHGTGRLRAAVRTHLRGHAAVARQRPGGDGEGGDGATIVTLRD